jgi:hypothetical protein
MVQGRPGRGNKRQQMLRAAREIKRQKREEEVVVDLPEEEEEVDLPEELLARVGVEDDSELEESELEYSEDEDFEEEEDCEVTDTEEDPVEVDNSALQTLMASSRELGFDAFEDNTTVFNYQRSAEPSVRTQYRRVQHARELEEGAKNTCTLEHDFQRPGNKRANPITLGRSLNHEVIFYPKFHCELNFIERYWCAAKYYARENCSYSLKGLRTVLPLALDSVTTAAINRYYNRCARVIEAYTEGFNYGTKEFTERVYKGHRQVVDKTKW